MDANPPDEITGPEGPRSPVSCCHRAGDSRSASAPKVLPNSGRFPTSLALTSRAVVVSRFVSGEGDGTRTRNHRIDRQPTGPAEKHRNPYQFQAYASPRPAARSIERLRKHTKNCGFPHDARKCAEGGRSGHGVTSHCHKSPPGGPPKEQPFETGSGSAPF